MKAYVLPPSGLSRAMTRVSNALMQYAPSGVKIVTREQDADLVFLHVIGWEGVTEEIERLRKHSQKYALLQYCLRTTSRPRTKSWLPVWKDAVSVWSYYDLEALAEEDHDDQFIWADEKINFYLAPLGVDSKVFKPNSFNGRNFLIVTSGYVAHTEAVAEASVATELMGGIQFHLGPEMHLGKHVRCELGITDEALVRHYSNSQFVAGLRRGEGFELPAAEGLLCGARPIMFDAAHYRLWFDEFAEFIPEGNFDDVVEAMHQIFLRGPKGVSREERELAVDRFNWEKIVNEFWQTI
jgi:hypothetical protein